jgi:hypothetical protein
VVNGNVGVCFMAWIDTRLNLSLSWVVNCHHASRYWYCGLYQHASSCQKDVRETTKYVCEILNRARTLECPVLGTSSLLLRHKSSAKIQTVFDNYHVILRQTARHPAVMDKTPTHQSPHRKETKTNHNIIMTSSDHFDADFLQRRTFST